MSWLQGHALAGCRATLLAIREGEEGRVSRMPAEVHCNWSFSTTGIVHIDTFAHNKLHRTCSFIFLFHARSLGASTTIVKVREYHNCESSEGMILRQSTILRFCLCGCDTHTHTNHTCVGSVTAWYASVHVCVRERGGSYASRISFIGIVQSPKTMVTCSE